MNIAGIIFLSLSILCILIPVIIAIIRRDEAYLSFSLLGIIWIELFLLFNYPEPTKEDVKNGKAIYVEEVNVGLDVNGDTLYNYSTYRIEWLPEWEYGRPSK